MPQKSKIASVAKSQSESAVVAEAITRPDAQATLSKIDGALKRGARVRKATTENARRALNILMDAKKLLAGNWTTGYWYRWAEGQEGTFCIQGAVRYVASGSNPLPESRQAGSDFNEKLSLAKPREDKGWGLAERTLTQEIKEIAPYCKDIPSYNDGPAASAENVQRLFDRAIAKLKEKAT